MICQWHRDCVEPVVAKIGLPGKGGVWVCQKGFDEWQAALDEVASANVDRALDRASARSD